jgi:xanthine dehydrogenase YagR molybdenum-binding subunit
MKLVGPIGETLLDKNPGIVGAPMDRVDGRLKVTGAARYSYEWPHEAPLYGYVVQAATARGTIKSIDTAAAERMPGVRLVLTYKNAPGLAANAGAAKTPATDSGVAADDSLGDFGRAFASAPVTVDVAFTTPLQSHCAMEPHATIARWDGDVLVLETANQFVSQSQGVVAATLKMPKEKVRIISKYVGGGFGGKLWVSADAILAAIAAKQTGRTVKVALARPQVFEVTTHRTDTMQRVRLGANQDGTLVAIGHDSVCANRPGETQYEQAALQTRTLYAGANRETRHRQVSLDVPVASSMRAPGEAVGLLALECAMDELAEKLGMDPIALRLKNEPSEDPTKHIPFSSRHLVACLQTGADRFGWSKRGKPGATRDGQWLVGMGVAAAIRSNPLKASTARVRLDPDGVLVVQTAMTDIGTGTYTILTQLAASLMGLPADRVRVELGDSSLPMAAGSGGSFGAGSSGSSVYVACSNLREKLAQAAGFDAAETEFRDGQMVAEGKSRALAGLAPAGGIAVEGSIDPGDNDKKYSQQSYGAQFAEVGVDADTGEIRLRRMLGVFTAGRLLNAKTARSQAIGGMIFGLGAALEEDMVMDLRSGHVVNNNLAEYHVPVHADVPELDAMFLPELDPDSNPLNSKGIGELGICGAGAAVANAIYNATGVRVRDYPITLDKVLAGMERRA